MSSMDVRKRKQDFGSAEKERKYNRQNNRAKWYFSEKKEDFPCDKRFQPKCTSSAEKLWGEIMDEEDNLCKSRNCSDQHPKSRRKIPLGDVNTNRPLKNQRKAVMLPVEQDEKKLGTRQRQIDIGKNTPGYKRYLEDVPRIDRTSEHPWTPNKFAVCSTRSWQGVMRIWRRKLHYWDPPEVVAQLNSKDSFFDVSTSTTESEDVYPKPRVNNSMETDDYFSSEGSQASSTEDCKAHEDDFLFSLDEPNIETDLFSMPFV